MFWLKVWVAHQVHPFCDRWNRREPIWRIHQWAMLYDDRVLGDGKRTMTKEEMRAFLKEAQDAGGAPPVV